MDPRIATLQWYIDAGVDEAIGGEAQDLRKIANAVGNGPAASQPGLAILERSRARNAPPSGAGTAARPLSRPPDTIPLAPAIPGPLIEELAAIGDLVALRARLDQFDGCALKATAMNTVFGVGPADAELMVIGEAPGEEEDRQGLPFVGRSGQLLDRMLASIGLEREKVYVTNTLYWRPPGNRTPTPQEVLACTPFLHRQIVLIAPKILLLVGGAAAKTVLQRPEGIMRLRGRWHEVTVNGAVAPIPAMATFHPAYLLRSPAQKREAWQDLLTVSERLSA
jgi:uracil-DNA glycosylase